MLHKSNHPPRGLCTQGVFSITLSFSQSAHAKKFMSPQPIARFSPDGMFISPAPYANFFHAVMVMSTRLLIDMT